MHERTIQGNVAEFAPIRECAVRHLDGLMQIGAGYLTHGDIIDAIAFVSAAQEEVSGSTYVRIPSEQLVLRPDVTISYKSGEASPGFLIESASIEMMSRGAKIRHEFSRFSEAGMSETHYQRVSSSLKMKYLKDPLSPFEAKNILGLLRASL